MAAPFTRSFGHRSVFSYQTLSDNTGRSSPTVCLCPSMIYGTCAKKELSRRVSSLRIATQCESLQRSYGTGFKQRSSGIALKSREEWDYEDDVDDVELLTINFSTVQIREYARALGDHPSCSKGAPIGIGWEYDTDEIVVPVDEYESTRPPRRNILELALPQEVRHCILLEEWGYSDTDIAKAVRQTIKVKNQRRCTVNNLSVSKMEETVEGAKRTVKRVLSFHHENKMSATEQSERLKTEAEAAKAVAFVAAERAQVASQAHDMDRTERAAAFILAEQAEAAAKAAAASFLQHQREMENEGRHMPEQRHRHQQHQLPGQSLTNRNLGRATLAFSHNDERTRIIGCAVGSKWSARR